MSVAALAVALAAASDRTGAQPADQGAVTGSVSVYADDDEVTVASLAVSSTSPVGERASLDAEITIDVITAASVDVVTAASPSPVRETRVEAGLVGTFAPSRTTAVTARAAGARENDYDGLALGVGARAELFDRTTTVDVTYTLARDWIGDVRDRGFERDRLAHRLGAGVTQILGRKTYLDLQGELQRSAGYHANPYRSVLIVDPASPVLTRLPEATPERRMHAAALARVRHAFGPSRWFAHGQYRLYGDDWGVIGHTIAIEAVVQVGTRLRLGARVRGHRHGAADFYQARYELVDGEAPAIRTADRALGPVDSLFAGLTSDLGLRPRGAADELRVVLAAGCLQLRWRDYLPQRRRTALITTASIGATF